MIKTKKSLGQHFILSKKITDQIANAAGDLSHFTVLEVGTGLGTLTESILKRKPKKLVSVEKDISLIDRNKRLFSDYKTNLKLINIDALDLDESTLDEKPIKVIANLPYNISTVLLIKWLGNIKLFHSLILMLQQEVADRIVALHGNKNYGTLSVITQMLCDVKKLYDFGPEIFHPPPKVNSSLVKVIPLPNARFEVDFLVLKKILNLMFNQRRKMIRKSLKPLNVDIKEMLDSLKIDSSLRPEDLSIEQICRIVNFF